MRLFGGLAFEVQQLCQLITSIRAYRLNPFLRVAVNLFEHCVNIQLYQKGSNRWSCHLSMFCRGLDWQLSFITEMLGHLSPPLSSVDELVIHFFLPSSEEDVDSTQFLELFRLFTHVSTVRVPHRLVPGVTHALATEDMAAEVLPRLALLFLEGYPNSSSESVVEAAEKFVAMRNLSGQSISLRSI